LKLIKIIPTFFELAKASRNEELTAQTYKKKEGTRN